MIASNMLLRRFFSEIFSGNLHREVFLKLRTTLNLRHIERHLLLTRSFVGGILLMDYNDGQ